MALNFDILYTLEIPTSDFNALYLHLFLYLHGGLKRRLPNQIKAVSKQFDHFSGSIATLNRLLQDSEFGVNGTGMEGSKADQHCVE